MNPCLGPYPFSFADTEADAAALIGRVTTPFIQRWGHHTDIPMLCKAIGLI